MSGYFDLLLAAFADERGRAQTRRALRHYHLEPAPLAIAALQMAGERYSLWGALVGEDPRQPQLIVAPEPRNRDIALAALAQLARALCQRVEQAARDREGALCRTAPQLLVANEAAARLLDRLAQRMLAHEPMLARAQKGTAGLDAGGAHLHFFAERAGHPGSSLLLVATRALALQFATGQSPLEDEHLGAQLAWIDPQHLARIHPPLAGGRPLAELSGGQAAELIERLPMGVLTDPGNDAQLLEAVERFNVQRGGSADPARVAELGDQLRRLLRAALEPTWQALWVARDVLAAVSEAPGAHARWEEDVRAFTAHVDYVAGGGRRARSDSPRRAAWLLAERERALAAFQRDQVLEDPYGLSEALCDRRAIRGRVVRVDADHRERAQTRFVKRPLIDLELALGEDCPFPDGAELWWHERPKLKVVVVEILEQPAGARVRLKVVEGQRGRLPEVAGSAAFTELSPDWVPPAPLPREAPWTHTPPAGGDSGLGRVGAGR